MRIAIMGSGGIGGYFGTRLALGGADVTFIARGAHRASIAEHGLRVRSALGDMHLARPKVTDDPAAAGPVDLVLFSVKLWDTETAAQAIAPLVSHDTAVVSFQNGVHKDEVLRRVLGEKPVIGGVSYIAATITEPGLIRHSGEMQKLVFGEYDGTTTERVARFRSACAAAGIDHEVSARIREAIWEKFVFLVGLSGTTATARVPIGVIRGNERARAFLHDVMDEAVQVARAEGVALPADYANDRLAFCDGLPAAMTSSMHHDLERGARLEAPWLAGDVVSRGTCLGIPTPCNRAVLDILSVHSGGRPA